MKKNELIRFQEKFYRILDVSDTKILVIDCMKLTMPEWIGANTIVPNAETITDEELCSITDIRLPDMNELSPEDKAIAHKRFTMISEIIQVIGNKTERCDRIRRVSGQYSISKQSIRGYL